MAEWKVMVKRMRQERWELEEIGEGRLFRLSQPTGSMSHTHLIQHHTDNSASHCNCFLSREFTAVIVCLGGERW